MRKQISVTGNPFCTPITERPQPRVLGVHHDVGSFVFLFGTVFDESTATAGLSNTIHQFRGCLNSLLQFDEIWTEFNDSEQSPKWRNINEYIRRSTLKRTDTRAYLCRTFRRWLKSFTVALMWVSSLKVLRNWDLPIELVAWKVLTVSWEIVQVSSWKRRWVYEDKSLLFT